MELAAWISSFTECCDLPGLGACQQNLTRNAQVIDGQFIRNKRKWKAGLQKQAGEGGEANGIK